MFNYALLSFLFYNNLPLESPVLQRQVGLDGGLGFGLGGGVGGVSVK